MHYVDEGPVDGHVMLLLHGMPTSSYLYRRMIPDLVGAGYRCIAPDHIGFGKSDKVLDDAWYSIERHSQALNHLIESLSLENITLFCQDWGGPVGGTASRRHAGSFRPFNDHEHMVAWPVARIYRRIETLEPLLASGRPDG
ncbi:MAG: hypothetical protein CM1200mP9_11000 [Gammaproteobacteria bacterium]|nr:MAG: hypothetical protein CM1200mP9_11000 [Gammaproteobacteria bacterium]